MLHSKPEKAPSDVLPLPYCIPKHLGYHCHEAFLQGNRIYSNTDMLEELKTGLRFDYIELEPGWAGWIRENVSCMGSRSMLPWTGTHYLQRRKSKIVVYKY